ncbi:hypothetical protein PPACK8108_LOCUS2263 [Phakopsora pachyrhizi]|uniref:Uncharacterized protein n=1 Tax=Phakopsora pachyrhizi TaxID=170000 RepID=A0AAV0AIL3_PHAPC|nr:hypothetical protein PPACK8108_LOCUS2262 [Phakopsora pachyrhizi]CAH7667832.1 hypothetical protein PPACK8108_LOCUS2263 [Phakopsora pachyrhizi]
MIVRKDSKRRDSQENLVGLSSTSQGWNVEVIEYGLSISKAFVINSLARLAQPSLPRYSQGHHQEGEAEGGISQGEKFFLGLMEVITRTYLEDGCDGGSTAAEDKMRLCELVGRLRSL